MRTMADVLALPDDDQRGLLTWMVRRGEVALAEAAAHLGKSEEEARDVLAVLAREGFVQVTNAQYGPRYKVALAPRGKRRKLDSNIWQVLE